MAAAPASEPINFGFKARGLRLCRGKVAVPESPCSRESPPGCCKMTPAAWPALIRIVEIQALGTLVPTAVDAPEDAAAGPAAAGRLRSDAAARHTSWGCSLWPPMPNMQAMCSQVGPRRVLLA